MDMDEEYLDNLLKMVTESEQQLKAVDEVMSGTGQTADDGGSSITSDQLADMLDQINQNDDDQHMIEEIPNNVSSGSQMIFTDENSDGRPEVSDAGGDVPVDSADSGDAAYDDTENWKNSLDELLAEADAKAQLDMGIQPDAAGQPDRSVQPDTNGQSDMEAFNPQNADVTDMIDGMNNTDAELAEINGLLKSADHNEEFEKDMLALLEGTKSDEAVEEERNSGEAEAFDVFAEDQAKANAGFDENEDDTEGMGEKPRKKKLFSRKGAVKREKKNRKREARRESEAPEASESTETEKRPGVLSRMFNYLTQEEDELSGASEENAQILQELDAEDRAKSKKAEKKKKKAGKKKGKNKADAFSEGEENAEAEEDNSKKKKKKEKKKKEKPPKEEVKQKPVKVLSRRNLLTLIAAGATIVAGICLLSAFLPEYADKRNARQAFYHGDYEEVYELLYDKKLNSNDALIYNKVRTVLTLERRLKSYENNLAMNRQLEALDALMQGVRCYQELTEADEYGVRSEVDAVYLQICGILQEDYGITPEEAVEINTYDNVTYTGKLYSVINGTEFHMPAGEEGAAPEDMLPDEEEMTGH